MLRVGLTGGLGSGKTTAAHLFAKLGVHVIQADEIGRALMQPGRPVYFELIRHFGGEIVSADGSLNRQVLADLAFVGGRLHELNQIVHPPVIAVQEEWMNKIFAADSKAIAMVESALIFEASGEAGGKAGTQPSGNLGRSGTVPGWSKRFDRIVLVTAPEEEKIARYVARVSNATPAKASLIASARTRLAAQMSDKEKAALSDYVIDNGGLPSRMEGAVQEVFTKLRAGAECEAR